LLVFSHTHRHTQTHTHSLSLNHAHTHAQIHTHTHTHACMHARIHSASINTRTHTQVGTKLAHSTHLLPSKMLNIVVIYANIIYLFYINNITHVCFSILLVVARKDCSTVAGDTCEKVTAGNVDGYGCLCTGDLCNRSKTLQGSSAISLGLVLGVLLWRQADHL